MSYLLGTGAACSPRTRDSRSGCGGRTVRTGMRWQVTPDAVFAVEATRRGDEAGDADNEVRMRTAVRF